MSENYKRKIYSHYHNLYLIKAKKAKNLSQIIYFNYDAIIAKLKESNVENMKWLV